MLMQRNSKRSGPTSSLPRIIARSAPQALKTSRRRCTYGSGRRVEIVSLKPDALADIWEDIAKVARARSDANAKVCVWSNS